MAASSPYTVMLDGRDHYLVDEGVVAAANTITPGEIVAWSSGEIIQHATAADTSVAAAFAIENDKIGDDLDHAYLATETCFFCYPNKGARVYAWLENTANVAKGAPLEANGAGALQALTTGAIVCWADEAVNNSGGGPGPASAARIRVRIH